MDLLTYINYYYVDESPDWVKISMGLAPKPLFEIFVDLLLKVIVLILTFMVLIWGARFLILIWAIHNEKIRELEELDRQDQEDLDELLRPPTGIGEGDNLNNPEDDDDDERREE